MDEKIYKIGEYVLFKKAFMRKYRTGIIISINASYPNGLVEYLVKPDILDRDKATWYCFPSEMRKEKEDATTTR